MIKNLPDYVQVLLQNGAILAVVNLVFLYVLVLTPLKDVPYIGYVRIPLIALEIWLLIRLLKITRELKKGYFDQVVTGTVMFGVVGIVMGLGTYLLSEYVRPNMLQEQKEVARQFVQEQDRSDEEKATALESIERSLTQPQFSLDQFTGVTSNGLIYALVAAAFVRYKKPKTEVVAKTESDKSE